MPILAEPGDSERGTDHSLDVSWDRRFPPEEFTHFTGIDFYILCGLFPDWANDTHVVAKVMIQNKFKL